eukprot:TRINITY_DN60776_c0_g1_i1.p1 TRINITY_DN60776_c0_g1~~TRINITY_DN60776_c0_g1_i1.p1  ORF type:complete len:445 (+),score=78.93 TRINITY_DN60776_c0_g1_i1:60-1394(+)
MEAMHLKLWGVLLAGALSAVGCLANCSGHDAASLATCTSPQGQGYMMGSLLSSALRTIGATVTGSLFALVGVLMETRKLRQEQSRALQGDKVLGVQRTRSAPAECGRGHPELPEAKHRQSQSRVTSQRSEGASCTRVRRTSNTAVRMQPRVTSQRSNGSSSNTSHRTSCAAVSTQPRVTPQRSDGNASNTAHSSPCNASNTLSPMARIAGRELSAEEQMERQVKVILNKLTREKFDTLYDQLLIHCKVECKETRYKVTQVIARELFKKATTQHNFIEMYAEVCGKLDADLQQGGFESDFRRTILEQCQDSFTAHLQPPNIDEGLEYEEHCEALFKYKTKMIGNVKFVGHLLKLRMLAAKVLFLCADELISIGSPEAMETLCAFLDTVGDTFDQSDWAGHGRLQEVFRSLELFSQDSQQTSRIRCLIKDLLEKKQMNWAKRSPKA